ncbi:MAG: HEAT repeat domain-containing protein, partial [Candidatus Electrothrix sp. AR3]|nr:HEAT repeat domain-containing protein [Candidatus Electrothrix sp. AR3]
FLYYSDWQIQFMTIRTLGQLNKQGGNVPISEIIIFLQDNDWQVRSAAIEALDHMEVDSAIPDIITLLQDGNPNVRAAAIEALGHMGVESAIPDIRTLLQNGNSDVRAAAIYALGQLGVDLPIPDIRILLRDGNSKVRSAAIYALGQLGVDAEIIPFLQNRDAAIQRAAALALARLNSSASELHLWQQQKFKAIQEKIKSKYPNKRKKAAEILGNIFTEQSMRALAGLMQDSKANVVIQAVESIGIIGAYHPELVQDELKNLLNYPNRALEETVIVALGRMISFQGKEKFINFTELDQKIRKTLQEIISDQDQTIRRRLLAIDALGATDRQECANDLYELFKQHNKSSRLRFRYFRWFVRMQPDAVDMKDILQNELKELEAKKKAWRQDREQDDDSALADIKEKQNKGWKKEHWEELFGNSLACIDPETSGIDLLSHPHYQVRQGAIRALAFKVDADRIGKIIQAHQDFNPKDLP